jgi:hypothetical protein
MEITTRDKEREREADMARERAREQQIEAQDAHDEEERRERVRMERALVEREHTGRNAWDIVSEFNGKNNNGMDIDGQESERAKELQRENRNGESFSDEENRERLAEAKRRRIDAKMAEKFEVPALQLESQEKVDRVANCAKGFDFLSNLEIMEKEIVMEVESDKKNARVVESRSKDPETATNAVREHHEKLNVNIELKTIIIDEKEIERNIEDLNSVRENIVMETEKIAMVKEKLKSMELAKKFEPKESIELVLKSHEKLESNNKISDEPERGQLLQQEELPNLALMSESKGGACDAASSLTTHKFQLLEELLHRKSPRSEVDTPIAKQHAPADKLQVTRSSLYALLLLLLLFLLYFFSLISLVHFTSTFVRFLYSY